MQRLLSVALGCTTLTPNESALGPRNGPGYAALENRTGWGMLQRERAWRWLWSSLGVLILGLLLIDKNDEPWLFVIWAWAWPWIRWLANGVWSFIAWDTDLPLGILILLLIAVFALGVWLTKLAHQAPEGSLAETFDVFSTLSLDARTILRFLAARGTKYTEFQAVGQGVGIADLRVELALNELLSRDLLLRQDNYLHGSSVRISPLGSRVAVAQGWL